MQHRSVLREQHPKATKAEMFKILNAAICQPANEDHLLGIIKETVGDGSTNSKTLTALPLMRLENDMDKQANGTKVIHKADAEALDPADIVANDPLELVRTLRAQHPRATDDELFKIFRVAIHHPENKGRLLAIIEEAAGHEAHEQVRADMAVERPGLVEQANDELRFEIQDGGDHSEKRITDLVEDRFDELADARFDALVKTRFDQLVNAFNAEFQPATFSERLQVEKMAASHWRLTRTWAVESAGIIHEPVARPSPPSTKTPPPAPCSQSGPSAKWAST